MFALWILAVFFVSSHAFPFSNNCCFSLIFQVLFQLWLYFTFSIEFCPANYNVLCACELGICVSLYSSTQTPLYQITMESLASKYLEHHNSAFIMIITWFFSTVLTAFQYVLKSYHSFANDTKPLTIIHYILGCSVTDLL